MVLPSALRCVLLCFVSHILLVPGISVKTFLSQDSIPDDKRVTTAQNIQSGVGVVRPAAPSPAKPGLQIAPGAPASAALATPAAFAPVRPRLWKIEAVFEMTSTAPVFSSEYDSSVTGFALTLADRLKWATDVPLSRFAFWLPDPAVSVTASSALFCETTSNENHAGGMVARYASAENATYSCISEKHIMNSSLLVSLLQTAGPKSITFEVGVYPASGVGGDVKPSIQVAEQVIEAANGDDEPVRKLLPTGLWTYKAGPGVRFHGLFPATAAAMPGMAFAAPRDTSLPLGPNPGGQGAEPPPTLPPGADEGAKTQEAAIVHIDSVVEEAKAVNLGVKNSLQELKDSLARASAVHSAWMNTNVYQLPEHLP